jgi:hypothetical protein
MLLTLGAAPWERTSVTTADESRVSAVVDELDDA